MTLIKHRDISTCFWFILMHIRINLVHIMNNQKIKRFSISMEQNDYERLRNIASDCGPGASLQLVINRVIRDFLNGTNGRSVDLKFEYTDSKG